MPSAKIDEKLASAVVDLIDCLTWAVHVQSEPDLIYGYSNP